MTDEKLFWIGFNLVKGIGAVRLQALLDHFGELSTAWQAPVCELEQAGLSPKIIQNLLQVRRQVDLSRILSEIERKGIQILTWLDALYPQRLKEIDQPPPVLYLKGSYELEDAWAVAVVGTRHITSYGRQVAAEIGNFLGSHGITVISGLARGVDAVAHTAALDAGGRSLAILGSGVDRIYPPENRQLAERLCQAGGLISDYAPGTPPDSANFPPRNRIISGLSLATVVIEAGLESGALITATFAAEQGREVFAVPGNVNAPQSAGANRLIQDGARPLLAAHEILSALELTCIEEKIETRRSLPSDPTESRIINEMGFEAVHADELSTRLEIPIETVSATLTMMELKGLVRQVGGMSYVAVRESMGYYGVV
ncbi:MAG: DNA-processing protein DprA [Anaerolineaceae bacterium]|nr:DNA-processing protein DprA [Anaerolineaceae bacterium]MBN2676890.1 DNA-processing protein DprA [Anaerolineaceae bacterium]